MQVATGWVDTKVPPVTTASFLFSTECKGKVEQVGNVLKGERFGCGCCGEQIAVPMFRVLSCGGWERQVGDGLSKRSVWSRLIFPVHVVGGEGIVVKVVFGEFVVGRHFLRVEWCCGEEEVE